eukprot:scaffold22070_cov44-Cyclotella_meneghiniana.AAC.1
MHAVCGYPVKTTWLKAIKAGNYVGWPLLTVKNVTKYYPETTETPKGHLNQTRKNVRSTKPKPFKTANTSQLEGKKMQDIHTQVYEVRETVFTDQTGQFPTQSRSGNKYIMVMVDIDSSGILVEPLKSRKDAELHRAYTSLMTRLNRAGIFPKKHVLDNEISQAMKDYVRDEYKMTVELVPPGCHRRNAAEVAIRNFKAHFLSILAGTADDFPLQLWDKLLPQAEITVNLLRQSNATPNISAYAHMNGPFDYNKMPLAPLGCNVQAILNKAREQVTGEKVPPEDEQSLPRVQNNKDSLQPQNEERRTTRSMTASLTPEVVASPPVITQPPPRVQRSPQPQVLKKRRKRVRVPLPASAPAANTRSK